LFKKRRIKRTCRNCGTAFSVIPSSPVHYCSIGCFNRRGRRKADMVRECLHCGKKYERWPGQTKRKFCSNRCARAYQFGQKQFRLPGVLKKGRSLKPEVDIKYMFPKCQRCGWDTEPRILHRHHKDRNRKNNDPSNIEILCPNCHVLEHFYAHEALWG
jgi:5-methylcytosine-specific restriction endonuclease McrA